MKTKAGAAAMSVILAIVATALWVAPVAAEDGGAPRITPPTSYAYGKTLTEWLGAYWRWYYGSNQDLTQSVVGRVQLMPLPVGEQVGGDGTPANPAVLVGELAITLPPGTPFVLPLVGLVGESYTDGSADDPAPFTDLLDGISPNLTIDGRTVVSDANKAAFYVPATYFDPIVVYPVPTSYGAVAGIFFQGIGIVSPPLPVGTHVIHLDESYILPGWWGMIFDNTWIVTVSPN